MTVTLREINHSNWKKCIRLNPGKDQAHFVAPNTYSLVEAAYEPNCFPLAIYTGEEMVGFVMYNFNDDDHNWWICRLMIDEKEQGKGYGRAGLREAIKLLAAKPDCSQIVITWEPENLKGEKLYLSEGFIKTGKIIEEEVVGRLYLNKA